MPDKRNERVIISDTSCLISLTNINRLDLLQKTYNEIIVTPEVAKEYGTPLPIWIKVMPVKNRARISEIHKNLDLGESSAIALAYETENPILVIDETKARKYARSHGFEVTGTIGVITRAYDKGYIENPDEVIKLIQQLRSNNFRIGNGVIENVKSQINPRKNNSRGDPGMGR